MGLIIAVLFATGVFGGGTGGAVPDIELPGMPAADGGPLEGPDPDARLVQFVGFVVDDVQDSWRQAFAANRSRPPLERPRIRASRTLTPTSRTSSSTICRVIAST